MNSDDASASRDNLDQAQRLADQVTLGGVSLQRAQALALIDIASTLRDIRDLTKDFDTYGLPVKDTH